MIEEVEIDMEPFRAVFRNGAFVPQSTIELADETEVFLSLIETPAVTPPAVSDPDLRRGILFELAARMKAGNFSANAPRLTREQLQERG